MCVPVLVSAGCEYTSSFFASSLLRFKSCLAEVSDGAGDEFRKGESFGLESNLVLEETMSELKLAMAFSKEDMMG